MGKKALVVDDEKMDELVESIKEQMRVGDTAYDFENK